MATHRVYGNDLTSRPVAVYGLDELRRDGCAAAAFKHSLDFIRWYAERIHAFHVALGDADSAPEADGEDSTAQVSKAILRRLDDLENFRRTSETDLALIAAMEIGQLYERLLFMWKHRDATRKGHQRIAYERLAQELGAEANRKKKRRRIEEVAQRLKDTVSLELLETLTDTALARKLKGAGLGGERTLRGHVAQVRKQGLLPRRQEM